MAEYKIKEGYTFGKLREYAPGDVIELTEDEATPFLFKLVAIESNEAEFGVEFDAIEVASLSVDAIKDLDLDPAQLAVIAEIEKQKDKPRVSLLEYIEAQ